MGSGKLGQNPQTDPGSITGSIPTKHSKRPRSKTGAFCIDAGQPAKNGNGTLSWKLAQRQPGRNGTTGKQGGAKFREKETTYLWFIGRLP